MLLPLIIWSFYCYKLQINRIESEFSSYKVRAHALLQKKDAELAAAKDNEQLKAHDEALKVDINQYSITWQDMFLK